MNTTSTTIENPPPDDDFDSDEIVVKQPSERVALRESSTNTNASSPTSSDHIKLQSYVSKPQRVMAGQTENSPPDDEYDSDEIVVTRPPDTSAPSRQTAPPEKPAIPSKRKTSAPNKFTKRKTSAPKTYSKKKYPRKIVEEPQVLEVSPVAKRTAHKAPTPVTPAAPLAESDCDAEVSGVESVLPSEFQPRTTVAERETPTPLPPAAEPSPRTLRSMRKVPAASPKARKTASLSKKRELNSLSAVVEEEEEDNINVKSAAAKHR